MEMTHLKTAFRSLSKNKTFSAINIAGLAMGTLCCIYISLYVQRQSGYDKHEDHAADIYRVNTLTGIPGEQHQTATSSPLIAPGMKHDLPEVQQFTRVLNASLFGAEQHLLKYDERSFYEKKALFVDSTFFDVFSYRFVQGDTRMALSEPYSAVVSVDLAHKLFGASNPIGKVIQINNKAGEESLKITGVVDASLGLSHIQANIFITMNSGLLGRIVRTNESWTSNFIYSYVKLMPGVRPEVLSKKLPAFVNIHAKEQLKALGMQKQLQLQPIGAIHTSDLHYEAELDKVISPSFLHILALIAILIQIIACINFMNMSTARAFKRAKEVGVRKVIGAGRGSLVRQFLGESILLSLAGVLLAIPLLLICLPFLNQVTGAEILPPSFGDRRLLLFLAGLVVCTGMLSGSYPAFYLSAFQAIRVFKGNFTNRVSAAGLRRGLVVLQFVLSTVLITGAVIIYSQLNYIRHKDLGFEKDQKIIFNIYTSGVNLSSFTDDLRSLPGVKAVTRSNSQLGKPILMDENVYLSGGDALHGQNVQIMMSDKYFVRAAGIKLTGGRDLRDFDSSKILINETLARRLGLDPRTVEGTRLYSQRGKEKTMRYEIAGVMKDFHFNSLHEEMKPLVLVYNPKSSALCDVMVNCNTPDYKALLSKMEALWRKDAPGLPFEYVFLDEEVQKQYEMEITLSRIINCFTGVTILISCLGLLGLMSFSAEQRRKELGIRKILGADVSVIVSLLSKDLIKLVAIALVISVPISWWSMHKWLEGFAYRVEMQWWMFALAGLIAMIIALGTVTFQAVKAAVANPVNSLRPE
jgi:putative ABC transport system permease protein